MDNTLSARLAAADFASARPLIEDYGSKVRQQLAAAPTPESRKEIIDSSLTFLQRQIDLSRTVRAHIKAELASIAQSSGYQDSAQPEPTFHLDA